MANDPEVKCYLPGVPRATYMPYPFQIVQSTEPNDILISYEFASASRVIHMSTSQESPTDTWMGWSNGRWEGDTLVVDVKNFVDQTWFDRAGNYHSDALHVVERYTPLTPDVIQYRGDDRGSERVHPSVEDEHAALPPRREERAAPGIQVRRVRGRTDVRASQQEARRTRSFMRNTVLASIGLGAVLTLAWFVSAPLSGQAQGGTTKGSAVRRPGPSTRRPARRGGIPTSKASGTARRRRRSSGRGAAPWPKRTR